MIELYLLFRFVHVYSMGFCHFESSKDTFVFISPTHLNILLENLDMHINSLAGDKNASCEYE